MSLPTTHVPLPKVTNLELGEAGEADDSLVGEDDEVEVLRDPPAAIPMMISRTISARHPIDTFADGMAFPGGRVRGRNLRMKYLWLVLLGLRWCGFIDRWCLHRHPALPVPVELAIGRDLGWWRQVAHTGRLLGVGLARPPLTE